MNRTLTHLLASIMVGFSLVGLLASSATSAELKELRIALLPNEQPDKEITAHAPMTRHLEKVLGIPVKVIVAIDYTAVIEAIRYNHVQVAYFGPFSYVLASEVAQIEPLVTGVQQATGSSKYNSVLIARTDSGIEKPQDIKGKTFAFLDPASTSGYLVPMAHFKKLGIDPQRDFKSVFFAGSHAAVELAVAAGKVHAGADNLPSYKKMVATGQVDPKQVRIIWKSEDIPGSPIAVRKDLRDDLKARLLDAFLNIPEGVDSYEGKMSHYERAYDKDYDVIREVKKFVGVK